MSSTFLGPGPGRRRKPRKDILTIRPSTAGLLLAAAASVLCAGPAAPAKAAPPPTGTPHDEDCEPEQAAPASDQHNGLLVIDNSGADSWLEVDRTLNTLLLSRGTAGSDHDGGGGAIDVLAGDITGADPVLPQIGHPPWQAGGGD
ncbi:hypothetical protein JK364_28750 [Streptomyces sp. 110]|uniref:Uncharacterized protein n=1 Tax=Streptomyces endocoffeicus TaxID=2898945 RepID=A0ABS1PVL8_9ACTN|nr:hypothetical protein [Streptomyces endocoffeicus]MBL1116354.1 hypothetical protein [Streptomyces endocoffeicus]